MPDDSNYLGLLIRLFDDFVGKAPEYTCRERDFDAATVVKRYRNEGLAFLTKTLPALGKELDCSFQVGIFEPSKSFKTERGRTTPMFLRAWFQRVFSETGLLLENPDPEAVGHIRQVCFLLYKLESEYTPELEAAAIKQFVDTDVELECYNSRVGTLRPIIWRARAILEDVFKDFDPLDIIPRPGPGASASGTHKSLRYEPLTVFDQVHQVYPTYKHFYLGSDHLVDRVQAYKRAARKAYPQSRLRLVPKDSRGPRIICMEEQEVMFLQQGLADKMRDVIAAHPITRGRVNFRDQTVNQRLATNASLGIAAKATLDMKEASDRISRPLVADLFEGLPKLREALLALSSPEIVLPGGTVMKTRKYAPMGSSLCFPVMSIVHFALGVACIQVNTTSTAKAIAKEFYVYGDDIVVHTDYVDHLFELFPKFGLVFNRGKSFVSGPFRESCGVDAFLGQNVTPQRIKKRFFDDHAPRNIIGALAIEEHLFNKGYYKTASYLRTICDYRDGVPYPYVVTGSAALGWRRSSSQEVDIEGCRRRYNRRTQSEQVRVRVFETEPDSSMVGSWERMVRAASGAYRSSQRLDGRFTRYVITWKWVPVFALHGKVSDKFNNCHLASPV